MEAVFPVTLFFAALMAATAVYCILMTRNLIRILIGLELLTKSVTLLLALGGYVSGRIATAQTFIITLIVIEVVVIAVAAGVVICTHKYNSDLDTSRMKNLKG